MAHRRQGKLPSHRSFRRLQLSHAAAQRRRMLSLSLLVGILYEFFLYGLVNVTQEVLKMREPTLV